MTEYLKSKAGGKGTGSGPGGKKAHGGNKKSKKDKNGGPLVRPYAKDIAYCQAVQSMCGGYYKASLFFPSTFLTERLFLLLLLF